MAKVSDRVVLATTKGNLYMRRSAWVTVFEASERMTIITVEGGATHSVKGHASEIIDLLDPPDTVEVPAASKAEMPKAPAKADKPKEVAL